MYWFIRNNNSMKRQTLLRLRGFTLIELAVVLTVIALMIGGILTPLTSRIEQQNYADTQSRLENATQALIGFAVLNGRLPCPSTGVNGIALVPTSVVNPTTCGTAANSDSSATANNVSWGDLPWGTLGIAPPSNADGWNNRLRYAVCTRLVENASFNTTNVTSCGIIINDAIAAANISTNTVFVVYSHGKNGAGATSITVPAPAAKPAPTSAHELENLPTHSNQNTTLLRRTFQSRIRTPSPTSPAIAPLEFDDLLTWTSGTALTAKLVAAGVWTP